jgi:erythromycin esterase-like protein
MVRSSAFPMSREDQLQQFPSSSRTLAALILSFASVAWSQVAPSNRTSPVVRPRVNSPSKLKNPSDEGAFVNWARKSAIPLRTFNPADGLADLQPLKTIVGNARIVAVGEATHGTHEFFELKHRILEFLATQMGFSIFSIEANMPEAYRLNDYVLHGVGNPKQLVKGMGFWTWDTEEVLNMLLWMREFNQSGKGRVEFTGFDMQTPSESMNIVETFVMTQDPQYSTTVLPLYQDVMRMAGGQKQPGVATAKFPLLDGAGRHVKFSGYIKTDGITNGYAGLWWRVDGKNALQPLAFDNMSGRGATGTTPWTYYEISMDVPADASHIYFGTLHTGDGIAWFDSLNVEVDGVPYMDAKAFDLDFESDTIRGFKTAGGYEFALDSAVAHSGKQSLRSRVLHTEVPVEAKVLANGLLIAGCRDIVNHLEAKRAGIDSNASALKNFDWIIQNARLVTQYVEMKVGFKSRDESMAENVKWIAEHNPGAKLVIWAHNGHVAHSVFGGLNHPMGMYLRETFKDDFVNFGFSFDQGSFRALEAEDQKTREFTVGAAPKGSLDRALALVGIPAFAIDLRSAPRHGAVWRWLEQPHATRSVGAVYSDRDSSSFVNRAAPEMFDIIIFVDEITAAHPVQ